MPLFATGSYDSLERPAIDISYIPDIRRAPEQYALAAQVALPFVTEWFGIRRDKPM